VPVAVLCATFAFLPPTEPQPPERPQTRLAVVAAVVLLVIGSTVSFLRLAPTLQFHQARDYVDNARAALAERPGLVLYDGGVPNDILIDWFVDDAVTSRVIGLVPEDPRFDRPAEDIYQLDAAGRPQLIQNLKTLVTARRGPVPKCGYLVEDGEVRIPLHRAVPGRQIIRIGYYTADAGPGTVRAGDRSDQVRFTDGLHVMHVVANGPLKEITVGRSIDVAPLCVTNVEVGIP
jgi:hypothetical protein